MIPEFAGSTEARSLHSSARMPAAQKTARLPTLFRERSRGFAMNAIGRLLVATLSLCWLSTPAAWALRTVVIDAGHGGHDRGGGPGQRIPEKPYTLDVARRLRTFLQTNGFRTVMTRDDDYFVTLGSRCAVANAHRDAVFISVHFNSARREGADGIETYYYTSRSSSLAAAIHRELVRTAGTENRGVRRRGFFVIRRTRIPAVLCECGFLTNRREGSRISGSPAYRQQLAEAIGRAIIAKYP
jgi:N-acetylmuramoyl-L-alanine amidase